MLAPLWEVENNPTTATAAIVYNRVTLTYKATIGVNSFAEKLVEQKADGHYMKQLDLYVVG